MGGAKPLTEDPRLASVGEFTREGVRKLVMFLDANNYNKSIPSKLLKGPPTTAEFDDMATFILRQLDPSFKITTKVSADLPEVFKLLRCVLLLASTADTSAGV